MTTVPIEAKKDGLAQLQDGCWKLTLKVHWEDMPSWLMSAPMGTRLACAIVEIGDDEEPVQHEISPAKKAYAAKTEGEKAVTRAAIMCKEMGFQQWLAQEYPGWSAVANSAASISGDFDPEIATVLLVCKLCGIDSRADIASKAGALREFLALERRYREATGQTAEQRQ